MIKTLSFKNHIFKKNDIKRSISESFLFYGKRRTVTLVNELKNLGFYYATKSGLSLGIEELKVSCIKDILLENANQILQYANFAFFSGFITTFERFILILNSWINATNFLTTQLVYFLQKLDPFNSLNLMVFSGARGNLTQVSQLIGIRGLISDSNGQIMEIPILHNFSEGLTLTDYLLSTYGARKGIVDTSLKTADAGYLTRRLIYSSKDLIIRDLDCFTKYFIKIYKSISNIHFLQQVVGKTCAETIYDFNTNLIIIYKNTIITKIIANRLFRCAKSFICIYSILTCNLSRSVCIKCYGWNLSSNKLITLGATIGINAAQSIGEPGTQLTMRTFHTGGSFTNIPSRQIHAKYTGFILFSQSKSIPIRIADGRQIQKLVQPSVLKLFAYNNFVWTFILSFGFYIYISNKSFILKNAIIAEIPVIQKKYPIKSFKTLIAPHSGELSLFSCDNMLYILEGIVYNIPFSTLLNSIFLRLKKFNVLILLYIKLCIFNNGLILKQTCSFFSFNNFIFIKKFHFFIFPIFWDIIYNKIIFFDNLNKIYIIKKLPYFRNSFLFLFASNLTYLYNIPLNGNIYYFNMFFYYYNQQLKHNIIFKNSVMFYIFLKSYLSIKITNFFFGDLLQEVHSTLILKLDLDNYITQLKFPGEILFKKFYINSITKIEVFKFNLFYKIFFYPILLINIPKNKSIKKFKFLQIYFKVFNFFNYDLNCLTFFSSNTNFGNLLITTLWLKTSNRFLYINFYNYKNKIYLIFYYIIFFNFFKFFLKKNIKKSLKFYPQFQIFEYLLTKMIIGMFLFFITELYFFNAIKKVFSFHSRVLFLTDLHYFKQYYEISRFFKSSRIFSLYNFCFIPFINFLYNGKIQLINSFSITIHKGTPYYITKNLQIYSHPKHFLLINEIFGFISFDQILTGDIIDGLSKIDNFFELRIPQNSTKLSNFNGYIHSINKQNVSNFIIIRAFSSLILLSKILLFLNFQTNSFNIFNFNSYDYISLGQSLTLGEINFFEFLTLLFYYFLIFHNLYLSTYFSFKRIQILLIKKIYYIYITQHVNLSSKHIAVIIRQLTTNIKIIWDYTNSFLVGEIITLIHILSINSIYSLFKKHVIYYKPYLIGITKVSLNSKSFLSDSSFQEPTHILANAAIEGRIDWLYGLQENIIIGRCTPIGNFF